MDEPESLGWNAIDEALQPLYRGVEPKHYGTLISYELGGPDPLRGISAYKRLDPVPHWHFVTYGFSELFAKESEDLEHSGWGFELTFRLATDPTAAEPPPWALNFLQNLARYVFKSGNAFAAGHYMNLNGPIALGTATAIQSIAFQHDPELPPIKTPYGKVDFLQIVGLTNDEERALKQWSTLDGLAVFAGHLPLLLTDLARPSLLRDPAVAAAMLDGARRDGSSTGFLFIDQLGWEDQGELRGGSAYRIIMSARQIGELKALLPFRLPFGRELRLHGQDAQITLAPGPEVAMQAAERSLRVTLDPPAQQRFCDEVRPFAGRYSLSAKPELELEVRRTEIRDPDGRVVETIG
jgi:hypothetical protein